MNDSAHYIIDDVGFQAQKVDPQSGPIFLERKLQLKIRTGYKVK